IMTFVAFAAVLFAVHRLKRNKEFEVGASIKQAFSKVWKILGSSLLFLFIIMGLTVAAAIFIMIFGLLGVAGSFTVSIVMIIILLLAIGIAYFLTRWSLFLGITVFE